MNAHALRVQQAVRQHTRLTLVVAALAGMSVADAARAQGAAASEPKPDKSGFHLFNPTPRDLMRDLSTDRPDTTESAYTVDAGHFQIEMSFVDFTYDRRNADEQTVRAFAVAPMLLKFGLLNNVDLQIGIDPYSTERTTDRTAQTTETIQGFGDTIVRLKVNLWGNDGPEEGLGDTAFAIMPFIKIPTANSDLGNRYVEGGVISALAIDLPADFSSAVMIELDFNRSADNDRYVVDLVHSATISHSIIDDLNGYLEYAGFTNLNGDEKYRGYFDAGLTYGLTPDIQLDAGIRVGLTKAAEDLGVFAGISLRF